METHTAALAAPKYLTFSIARKDFAMDVTGLRGILPIKDLVNLDSIKLDPIALDLIKLDSAARESPALAGFAFIGEQTFPVIDLRRKLGLRPAPRGRSPCIVVMDLEPPDGRSLIGFIADRVCEVVSLRKRDMDGEFVHSPHSRARRLLDPYVVLGDGRGNGAANVGSQEMPENPLQSSAANKRR